MCVFFQQRAPKGERKDKISSKEKKLKMDPKAKQMILSALCKHFSLDPVSEEHVISEASGIFFGSFLVAQCVYGPVLICFSRDCLIVFHIRFISVYTCALRWL